VNASKTGKYILAMGTIIIIVAVLLAFRPTEQSPVDIGQYADTGQYNIVENTVKQVTVYKSANCGCCIKWNDYLRKSNYQVTAYNSERLVDYKASVGVPVQLQSCHTALIGGYVIEGHVPLREIERLLNEKPDAVGLSVPGMVSGSPGMESGRYDPYDVVLFYKDGRTEVFASY